MPQASERFPTAFRAMKRSNTEYVRKWGERIISRQGMAPPHQR
jgi:hypothetical protein